jgi:hypothetical protein
VQFQAGQKAWLSTQHLPLRLGARKLASKWAGPYPIVKKVAEEAYQLQLPESWRIHDVFHTSQLKEVVGNPPIEEPIKLDDGQEEFEVERILGERTIRGKREFLIKWKNYGDFENSWEPEENLVNA